MAGTEFKRTKTEVVETIRRTGVTSSSSPAKIYKVPKGSAIKIYPTSAGSASVYSCNTPRDISDADDSNAAITGSTNSSWDVWAAGSVSVATVQEALVPVEVVAIVVSSGTWVLEVSA